MWLWAWSWGMWPWPWSLWPCYITVSETVGMPCGWVVTQGMISHWLFVTDLNDLYSPARPVAQYGEWAPRLHSALLLCFPSWWECTLRSHASWELLPFQPRMSNFRAVLGMRSGFSDCRRPMSGLPTLIRCGWNLSSLATAEFQSDRPGVGPCHWSTIFH